MPPDEILRHAAATDAKSVEDVSLVRCLGCDEITLVYLEVGARSRILELLMRNG